MNNKPPCTQDGCTEPSHARGLCAKHYKQQRYQETKDEVKARARRWRQENAEHKRELDRKYREEHVERRSETHRRWRERNAEHRRQQDKQYYLNHQEERAERRRKEYAELKLAALQAYGDGSCRVCGARPSDIRELELCYEGNGGAIHRQELTGVKAGRSTTAFRKLREQGWPQDRGIVTLCAPCRAAKTKSTARTASAVAYRNLKTRALLAYGDGSCAVCGTRPDDVTDLELDHVNGDGAAHREQLGAKYGYGFLSALRAAGWPNEPPLQTLCVSCHKAKSNLERATRRWQARQVQ